MEIHGETLWNSMEFSMEFHGIIPWHFMEIFHGILWNSMGFSDMEFHGIPSRNSMELHGIIPWKLSVKIPWNYSVEFHEMFRPLFLLEFKFLRRTLGSMAKYKVKLQI